MNLASLIEGHTDSAVALISRGKPTTYGELRAQVGAVRGALSSMGVQPGDRVAVASANNPVFPLAYLAALGSGAVVVPLNPASPTPELDRELRSVRPRVLFYGPAARAAISGLVLSDCGIENVVASDGDALDGARPLADLLSAAECPIVDREPGDLAVLAFTSGTAGAPKAAMLTHGNLLANISQIQHHPGRALRSDDVALGALPMFHIFGLNVVLGLTLRAGGSVVLVERFDPATALETISRHSITMVAGAPPMFSAWASLPDADPTAFSSVRLAVSGAAPLAESVAVAFEDRYGISVMEGYGLTEASPVVTSSVIGGRPKRGSVGLPLPGVEVRLVDEEGEDALLGDPGEVWVRGPNVFSGYWQDPDASAAVLSGDAWLRTGDIAVADDDGYLYLVDRSKDLVIVSGFNVFPAEVEEVLMSHPAIGDAAVVGVSHPHTGEAVKAFVVARAGQHLEEDEVIAFCANHLARYKCPVKVMFVDEIPHSAATGKVLRRQLQ